MTEVCKFFLQGNCRFGNRCRASHAVVLSVEDQLLREEEEQASREAECGICCDKVTGSFGLLVSCNCVFCLNCIKEWRLKGKEIADKATVRLCPLCRKESLDVIPSKFFVKHPARKQELLDSYRSVRSAIPCKFYKSSTPWSCPFGNACVYAHLLPDGSHAPPLPEASSRNSCLSHQQRRRASSRHPRMRSVASESSLDFPDANLPTHVLRDYFESVVRDVVMESGTTAEVAEQLIRAVVVDIFTDKYGVERVFEIIASV